MSVGVFLGIREAYVEAFRPEAIALHEAINRRLIALGLDPVGDPDPDEASDYDENGVPPAIGRSDIDAASDSALGRLGKLAGARRAHTYLLALNPYRVVYVPRALPSVQTTDHVESFAGRALAVRFGSSAGLRAELIVLAPALSIPLDRGRLSDEVAAQLVDGTLGAGDRAVEQAWLLLHEAACRSIALDVPLVLSG